MVARRKNRVSPPPERCPLTECLAVIGGAWTPNILWYLGQGPRTFSELKSDIGRISAKVLSARLKRLVADGVLDRTVQPTSPPTVEYALTEFGGELRPAIEAIVAVGHRIKSRHVQPKATAKPGGSRKP